MTDNNSVVLENRGQAYWITINRPEKRNAINGDVVAGIVKGYREAHDDPDVRVIVLTGAGDKAFCAGGDVKDQSGRNPNIARAHMRRVHALSTVMRMMDKPVIAKVRGFCVGAGNEINIFCDLTIASENAKFGQVGPRVGSVPVWGACQLLARFVGERKAREMVYTCRIYSAQESLEMGLINQVVPDGELDKTVAGVCEEVLSKSPQAIRIAKIALNAGSDQEFYGTFFSHAELLSSIVGNEENLEGVTAFLEKRPTNYKKFRRAPEPRAQARKG
jgi:dihydroxynaphthoic acid synthetase